MKEVKLLQKRLPELLSPAGSWEALTAAVQNGADAVYMGGTRFNARRLADNFDNESLRKAVEYAHLYGVRIYITLNILIKEKELDEMKAFVSELEELRVDGVIVQDLGAARYIAQNHPALSLHASTQMTIHQLEGVKVLEEMGFSRVIPARELTLEELKHISGSSCLELETFIHGALCVSYSGQCLMSSMLGGRSGNRGMCAQPCRLAYTLNKDQNNAGQPAYHLSMKDLSTVEFLDEILAAGVTGLKIEGRMKRPEYVAIVTREYRKALDDILKAGYGDSNPAAPNEPWSSGFAKPDTTVQTELAQVFNRGGFTKGYYFGTDHTDLFAREKPNHWGIFLGRVTGVERGVVWVALEEELEIGDGIEFWSGKPGNKGQTVSSLLLKGRQTDRGSSGQVVGIPSSIQPEAGSLVYRTSSAAGLKAAQASYSSCYNRKIPVTAHAVFKIGKSPVLVFRDSNGLEGKAAGEFEVQAAVKRALDENTMQEQLSRLGDTPFEIASLNLEYDDNCFIPVSVLNQLRREAAKDLTGKRIAFYDQQAINQHGRGRPETACSRLPVRVFTGAPDREKPNEINDHSMNEKNKPLLNGYVSSLDFHPQHLTGLDSISFEPDSFTFRMGALQEQIRAIQELGIPVRLVLPAITRKQDMNLLRSLPDAFWNLFDDFQIGNIGQIKLLQEMGIERFYGSHPLNAANSLSLAQLYDLGLKGVTLSTELTIAEINDIINKSLLQLELLVYGRIVLMTLEYCPLADEKNSCHNCRFNGIHTLTDRKGYTFPIRKKRIARCYSELLNSQPLFLADKMEPFHRLQVQSWGLKLEGLPAQEYQSVIQCYRYALDYPGSSLPADLAGCAESVKEKGFTRGHFFRGVE